MTNISPMYSIGDMVVHRSYGVGQIEVIDSKTINGIEVECFKVKTENGMYWFPTDSVNNPRVHPVASKDLILKAIALLRSAPSDLENDPVQWKERIEDVQTDGDFLAICSLIRDLSALKSKSKLNRTQDQALNNLEHRLVREWAASMDIDAKSIILMIEGYLQESKTLMLNAE